MGLPAATEFLDPIVPQYIADLVTWAAIGARTTESQTHREMASGLSMPVGLKNSTDGSLQMAIDAMGATRHAHSFLGIDQDGATAIVRTSGNPHAHVVLRGGRAKTNYDAESIRAAEEKLISEKLPPVLMVDCSHANSEKKFAQQEDVWRSVIQQRVEGTTSLIGLMVESHLERGQPADSEKHWRTCDTACPSPTRASAGKRPSGCCAGVTKLWRRRRPPPFQRRSSILHKSRPRPSVRKAAAGKIAPREGHGTVFVPSAAAWISRTATA